MRLDGVRFQSFKNLTFLYSMDLDQLKNYLSLELKDISKLKGEIEKEKQENLKAFKNLKLKIQSLEAPAATELEKQALIAKIIEARAQKVNLANSLQSIRTSTAKVKLPISDDEKSSGFGDLKEEDKFGGSSRRGKEAHDAYRRVMEGLTSQQADLRETWDSDDIIAIDDYVMETGVSYDEAKEYIESQGNMEKATEVPEDI